MDNVAEKSIQYLKEIKMPGVGEPAEPSEPAPAAEPEPEPSPPTEGSED